MSDYIERELALSSIMYEDPAFAYTIERVPSADVIPMDMAHDYGRGRIDMFIQLSSAEYGKQCYFLQDNGMIYSRRSGQYMTVDDAIKEFIRANEWDI